MEVVTDESITAYQCMTIMDNGNYIRVNAKLAPQQGLIQSPDDAMDDVSKTNIKRLKQLGDFWFDRYGDATVELLMNTYNGPSLDKIDPVTGQPIEG